MNLVLIVSALGVRGELHLYRAGGSCAGPARHRRTPKPRVGAATDCFGDRHDCRLATLGRAVRVSHDTVAR